jgi:hypothetical protein
MGAGLNRIFEFTPTQESVLVSRVLVSVHKAVDENFPGALQTSRQFTKTVFSDNPGESTAIDRVVPLPPPSNPGEPLSNAEASEASGQKEQVEVPPSPSKAQSWVTFVEPIKSGIDKKEISQKTGAPQESQFNPFAHDEKADWGLRILIAALLSGLILLGWILLM